MQAELGMVGAGSTQDTKHSLRLGEVSVCPAEGMVSWRTCGAKWRRHGRKRVNVQHQGRFMDARQVLLWNSSA